MKQCGKCKAWKEDYLESEPDFGMCIEETAFQYFHHTQFNRNYIGIVTRKDCCCPKPESEEQMKYKFMDGIRKPKWLINEEALEEVRELAFDGSCDHSRAVESCEAIVGIIDMLPSSGGQGSSGKALS